MKEKMSVLWLNIRVFIVKMFYLYLALLSWVGIILMIATIVFIPLFIYLKEETGWFDEPFYNALRLGDDYYYSAVYNWKEMNRKKENNK